MTKFRLFYNKDKETEWLNEMSRKGYALSGFCAGFYFFEPCEPGQYIYQIDFIDGFFRLDSGYREFMSETGVEVVCLWCFWAVLRKKASEGAFELYTDVESKIEHYTKIRNMFKVATCIEIACLVTELFVAMSGFLFGKVMTCVMVAIVIVFIREVVRLNEILAQLKGRIGVAQEGRMPFGRRKPSLLIPIGMLLNGCSLAMRGNEVLEDSIFRGIVLMLAIAFMVLGLILTAIKREHDKRMNE